MAKSAAKKDEASKSRSSAWRVHFFKRHRNDDSAETIPARNFLLDCPEPIRAKLMAVVTAVAEAPPPQFAGGGKWEAMHGYMAGIYEVRVDGPDRRHYRLFCILERDGLSLGLDGPSLVLLGGQSKPFRTVLSDKDYRRVKRLAAEYRSRSPRSVE